MFDVAPINEFKTKFFNLGISDIENGVTFREASYRSVEQIAYERGRQYAIVCQTQGVRPIIREHYTIARSGDIR